MKNSTLSDTPRRHIPVDEVMSRLRDRVQQELAVQGSEKKLPPSPPSITTAPLEDIPKFSQQAIRSAEMPKTLRDYTDLHDEEFIRAAYRGLLGREPDSTGWTSNLTALREGIHTKTEILGRIRYSKEGRRHRRHVAGLLPRTLLTQIYRIPILGYLLRLSVALARLPISAANSGRLEASTHHQYTEFSTRLDDIFARIKADLRDLEHRMTTRSEAAETSEAIFRRLDEIVQSKADISSVSTEISGIYTDISNVNTDISKIHEFVALNRSEMNSKVDVSSIEELVSNSIHGERLESLSKRLEAMSLSRVEEARARIQRIQDTSEQIHELTSSIATIPERIDSLENALLTQVEKLSVRQATLEDQKIDASSIEGLVSDSIHGERLDSLSERIEAILQERAEEERLRVRYVQEISEQLHDYRLALLEEQRRVALLLEESRKRLPQPIEPSQIEAMVHEEEHLLDAMYSSLEDRFRGTRAEIMGKLEIYIPSLEEAAKRTKGAPAIDLGCGRGEWLEVLAERSIQVTGIDINHTMVRRCQEANLDAVYGNAIEFLRDQPAKSLGAVTAFHLLEHLPFRELVSILDESIRVLRPGGIAIFETPNPENLSVGATGFYADPTHKNPLYPPTLQFLLEQRGFVDVQILRPYPRSIPDWMEPLASDDPSANRINPILDLLRSLFHVSPDFAAIGRKA